MGLGADSAKVKTAFRRSNPYETTSPNVAIGLGLTYASAALKPAHPHSAEVLLESIEGVLRVAFKFDGTTGDEVDERL